MAEIEGIKLNNATIGAKASGGSTRAIRPRRTLAYKNVSLLLPLGLPE